MGIGSSMREKAKAKARVGAKVGTKVTVPNGHMAADMQLTSVPKCSEQNTPNPK